ncbi:hypothetical protein D3C86_1285150 [compost metagenome]
MIGRIDHDDAGAFTGRVRHHLPQELARNPLIGDFRQRELLVRPRTVHGGIHRVFGRCRGPGGLTRRCVAARKAGKRQSTCSKQETPPGRCRLVQLKNLIYVISRWQRDLPAPPLGG